MKGNSSQGLRDISFNRDVACDFTHHTKDSKQLSTSGLLYRIILS